MICRLLYLVGQLRPGGSERQLLYLLEAMDRERYRPAVAIWSFSETDAHVATLRALNVPMHVIPNPSSRAAKLQAFRRLVAQLKPEVVHSYSFYTNFAAFWGVLGAGAVAIGSVRGDFTTDKKECGPLLGRLSSRWPRHQIFNSASAAATSRLSRTPFAPKRVHVVRNGLDEHRFRSSPVPADTVRIAAIGSLVPLKRWDRLLTAAVALKRNGIRCAIRIAGDGDSRTLLEEQARNLGVSDVVEFLGYTQDVQSLLASSRFLVHTSDSEGYPNVILEAMSCGRAVVATDAGDVRSLVADGRTGFIVSRGDEATLVARMMTLIKDTEICSRMGEAGRAAVESRFRLDHLVAETLEAYRTLGWTGA
jgi:glycosyltransferase involved in cell wall biosynthesis